MMTATDELRIINVIARTIYGNAAEERLARLQTAHDAADAEFDGYLAEYMASDEAKHYARLYAEIDLEFTLDDIEELEF